MTRLGPLAERDFRILFLARSTSLLGSAVAPIALVFAVLDDLGDRRPTWGSSSPRPGSRRSCSH